MSHTLKLACIIDDDTVYINLIKKLFQLKKFCDQVLVFKNGKEAITFFETSLLQKNAILPELILLDLNMPVMNGWEFLNEYNAIKSRLSSKPNLYVVSSSINPVDSEKAKNNESVNDYISKPISIAAFDRIFGINTNLN